MGRIAGSVDYGDLGGEIQRSADSRRYQRVDLCDDKAPEHCDSITATVYSDTFGDYSGKAIVRVRVCMRELPELISSLSRLCAAGV